MRDAIRCVPLLIGDRFLCCCCAAVATSGRSLAMKWKLQVRHRQGQRRPRLPSPSRKQNSVLTSRHFPHNPCVCYRHSKDGAKMSHINLAYLASRTQTGNVKRTLAVSTTPGRMSPCSASALGMHATCASSHVPYVGRSAGDGGARDQTALLYHRDAPSAKYRQGFESAECAREHLRSRLTRVMAPKTFPQILPGQPREKAPWESERPTDDTLSLHGNM